MRRTAIHQFMPGFLYGDAVGNQASQIRAWLRSHGFRSQVYAQHRDRRLADPGLDYDRYRGDPEDLVLFHYSIGSPLTEFVRRLPGRVVPYYHNVTPAGYLRGYNEPLADLLAQGRRDLALFRDAPLSLAASEYNRQEMLGLGFDRVELLPYAIGFDALFASARAPAGQHVTARYRDGASNILFVGRLVPNKRQDDLIRAFRAYHHVVNPNSRLLLIGSDTNAPGYRLELETMAAALDLSEHVVMPGAVGLREGLGGYYQAADLFLCLSEHEGFCIPLLEAMAFDVPVVAFHATGVPYALEGSGVLVYRKHYDLLAELIDLLLSDSTARKRLIAGQRRRLVRLSLAAVETRLGAIIEELIEAAPRRARLTPAGSEAGQSEGSASHEN